MGTATIELDPPAEAPADEPPFRMLSRAMVIRSNARSNPLQSVIYGELARIDGRFFARWSLGSGTGTVYAEVNEDDIYHRPDPKNPVDFDITPRGVIIDPPRHVAGMMEARGADRWPTVDLRTPEDIELARFLGDWPTIGKMLGLSKVEPFRLFDPGPIRAELPRPGKPALDWPVYLKRHLSGDFGFLGEYDETPLSPAEEFRLGLLPASIQSRAAVANARGIIRSQYILPDDFQAAYRHPYSTNPACAEVTTALWSGGNWTLCCVGHISGA